MASNKETSEDSMKLTIEELKRETKVTDQQLETRIEQTDIPVLASYFDNINDGYLQKMDLTLGQQTDVKEKAKEGTLAGMILALTLWLNSHLKQTFRAMIVILLSLGKSLVAVQVFNYLSKKKITPFLGSTDLNNPKLSSYRDYLQNRYRKWTLQSISQWPPTQTKKVIKLAMIQKEKIQNGGIDDEFVKQTIRGNVDDILFKKTPVELKNIFLNTEDQRKFVLIEGAPGSGKSTLALHICQEWAEGKLFQEFDIVILVRLRDPMIKNSNLTIKELLPRRNIAMASEIESEIIDNDGKSVLWVLDGWDELPSDLPQNSVINKLIQPDKYQESPLHDSIVIVTSRPSSSAELHPLVSSRVEVLGFTPHQLEQYFTECLNGDSQAVQNLLDRIRENPAVEGSCYLPLNASIVVNCFLFDSHSLPTSNHEIFKSLVQSSLKRYLKDRVQKKTPVGSITSPDSLPSELRTPFLQMCQLAYHGIYQNMVTFTDIGLASLSIPSENISDVGLIQSVPSILGNDQLVYYCFLHLSIQELLAAIHISLMSPENQFSVFEMLFGQPRFSAVFQFYAGITKLQSKVHNTQSLNDNPTSVLDLVRKVVKSECEKRYSEPKPLLLSLMNCLYEAKDSSLNVFVADLLDHELSFAYTTMNPIDCLSIGCFVSFITGPFQLDLHTCYISDKCCAFLAQGLLMCSHSQCELDLNLSYNRIHDQGIHHIAELLLKSTLLFKVSLVYNPIGNDGLNTLCRALVNNEKQSTNTSLKYLNLNYCSITISSDTGLVLSQLLKVNNSLEELSFCGNTVTSCHQIATGLAENKALKRLELDNCTLTDSSIEELLTGLINNITYLDISSNNSITEDGMKTLAEHLTTHCPKLDILIISGHNKEVFKETNRQRTKNKLAHIVIVRHEF